MYKQSIGGVVKVSPLHVKSFQALLFLVASRLNLFVTVPLSACYKGCWVMLSLPLWMSGAASNAYAHDQAAEQYVESAWNTCFSASRNQYQNPVVAQQEFDQALNDIQKAIEIDPSIIDAPSRQIAKRLDFCHEVGSRFKKEQAESVLLEAFKKCDAAKDALVASHFAEADALLSEYQIKRNEALRISDPANFLKTLFVKMRYCDQMDAEIASASDQYDTFTQMSKQANAVLRASALTCKNISSRLQEANVDISLLEKQNLELKKQLNGVLDHRVRLPKWIEGIRGSHPTAYQKFKKGLDEQLYCVAKIERDIKHTQVARQRLERKQIENELEALISRINQAVDSCEQDALLVPDIESIDVVEGIEEKWSSETPVSSLRLDIDNLLQVMEQEKLPDESLNEHVLKMNECVEHLNESLEQQYTAIVDQDVYSLAGENELQNESYLDVNRKHGYRDWRKLVKESTVEEDEDPLSEE